jgi:hypothetical protein
MCSGCLGSQSHKRLPFDANDLIALLSMSDEVETPAASLLSMQKRRTSSNGPRIGDSRSTSSPLLAPLLSLNEPPSRSSAAHMPPPSPCTRHLPLPHEQTATAMEPM